MKISISKGNQKVKCPIFSVPSLLTCPEKVECRKYCYDCKASRIYPSVRKSRENNLNASKNSEFVSTMIREIKGLNTSTFRIHAGGDFYSSEYIESWYKIIESMPNVNFLAYTKDCYRDVPLFTEEVLKRKPKNLRLLKSLDGIKEEAKLNDFKALKGLYDGVAITHKTLSNCQAQLKDDVRCMVECRKCFTSDLIVFKKH